MLLKKKILIISVIILTSANIWAGDSASFVDLGFSPDGRNYMFGQYGVLSSVLKPWAELYIVDVRGNNFVQNGRVSFTQENPIKAGQDGSGVFYRLLTNNSSLANQNSVNFQNQGLPLYISREENPPENGETIDFRDFISGNNYTAELIFSRNRSGQNVSSSFYINMKVKAVNGQEKKYMVGNPSIVRAKVQSYHIKRVLIDSTGSSIIFVIEMKQAAESGFNIRYMVEAQKL